MVFPMQNVELETLCGVSAAVVTAAKENELKMRIKTDRHVRARGPGHDVRGDTFSKCH